jgi:hypothetical protein
MTVSPIATKTLDRALKEWNVAIDALEKGKMFVLLRKGGIKEDTKSFQVPYRWAWLYPTYEHQKPELLKTEYSSLVTPVASGWHPDTVRISSCVEITEVFSIKEKEQLEALSSYHIWNEIFLSDRLKWKPNQPLSVLLLRTYFLPQPIVIPYNDVYKGCKSWIDLVEPISLERITPVLDDDSFDRKAKEISFSISS